MKHTPKYGLPIPDNTVGGADDPADIKAYATDLANVIETLIDSRAPMVSESGSFPVYQHATDSSARSFPIRLEWKGSSSGDTIGAWTVRVVKLNGGAGSTFNLARNDGHNTEIGASSGAGHFEVLWQPGTAGSLPDIVKGSAKASTRAVKEDIVALGGDAPVLPAPVSYRYVESVGDGGRERFGFIAEDVPEQARTYSGDGVVAGVDERALVALLAVEVRRLTDRVILLENIMTGDSVKGFPDDPGEG